MTDHLSRTLAVLGLGLLYAILFYHYEMGVNLVLFDVAVLLTVLRFRPELPRNRGFIWSVAGWLFAAGSVVVVHSPASILAHHLTYFLVLGYAQSRELRFIGYAVLLGGIALARGPIDWYQTRLTALAGSAPVQRFRHFGAAVIALLIVFPFLCFYLIGNEALGEAAATLSEWLSFTIKYGRLWSVVFLTLLAVVLCLGLFFPRTKFSRLVDHQNAFTDELAFPGEDAGAIQREEEQSTDPPEPRMIARITLLTLNALLLLVNLTDLRYVWLPADDLSAATLSHYVHVGTFHLVASVCLAMAVVLYFFRGDLNWEPTDNLQRLAKLWLVQNGVLLLSVGIRNYHYIDAYGLAIGRVYVIFTLALLLFGLLSLHRKVDRRLSLTYLLQTNGMALWLTILVFGAVNWAGVITRYNLATQDADEIDVKYLYNGFDGRNDFLLLHHPKTEDHPYLSARSRFRHQLYTDWRGWNYTDHRNRRARAR